MAAQPTAHETILGGQETIQYGSDADGKPVGVIVPLALWQERVMASEIAPEMATLPQGSPDWKARLRQWGQDDWGQERSGVSLTLEATSREALYGDDLR